MISPSRRWMSPARNGHDNERFLPSLNLIDGEINDVTTSFRSPVDSVPGLSMSCKNGAPHPGSLENSKRG